jgi:hypothetical protein
LPITHLARSLVWAAIVGPPIFLFIAVQHSALTHPFWDYCELIPYVDKLQSGTLAVSDLFAPHNHTRPAAWRALLLANAWLTGWDIRSEYVYLLGALVGAFLVQVQLLRRCCASWPRSRMLAFVAILSVVSFSPAAHNNHWWSMMIQLDMAHMFAVIALALMAWRPNNWRDTLLAALACWLATYTLTNGLVAFVCCAIVTQLFGGAWLRPNRFTLFWAANIVLVLVLYLPGLPASGGGTPSLGHWLTFSLAYLGSPAVALIWFPFQSMFDVPHVTAMNVAAGFVVVLLLAASWYWIRRARITSTAARAFVGFALFAAGSAALTGLGRAEFDELGLSNANASRYTLFSSWALYAILYAATLVSTAGAFTRPWMRRLLPATTWLVIVACATLTYVRSWKIYAEARRFDGQLAIAYASPENETPFDHLIYPVRERIPYFKSTLKRLRLGPYRDAPENDPLERLAGTKLADEFGINGLRAGANGVILFAHPRARFSIDLPRETTRINFRYGVLPEAITATSPTDGVEFRVLASDRATERILWSSVWRPAEGTPTDQRVTVVLPQDGFPETLIFETLSAGRSESDWAYWADLALVRKP